MDGFNGEIWNEFQWEVHLSEIEKKSEQFRRFIESDVKGNVPRWITLLKESLSEDDAFEAYVEEELLMDEAYFPEDEDDWDDEDEFDEDDFLFGFDEFSEFAEDDDDYDQGEDWKELSEDFALSNNGSLDNLELFREARLYAIDLLKWAESIQQHHQDQMFFEYVGDSLKIGAKLAGGYSFGFELEFLGANIVYTKKALHYANQSLEVLQKLKRSPLFTKQSYGEYHSRLFELRNNIGIYIQELRDRFNSGLV